MFHIPTLNKDVTPDLDKESTEDPSILEPCDVYNGFTKADVILLIITRLFNGSVMESNDSKKGSKT